MSQNRIPKSLMCPIFQNPLKLDIKGYATRHKIIKILKSSIRILEINLVLGIETFIWRKINSKLGFVWFLKDKKEKKMLLFSQVKQRKQIEQKSLPSLVAGDGSQQSPFFKRGKKKDQGFFGEREKGGGRKRPMSIIIWQRRQKEKRGYGLWRDPTGNGRISTVRHLERLFKKFPDSEGSVSCKRKLE